MLPGSFKIVFSPFKNKCITITKLELMTVVFSIWVKEKILSQSDFAANGMTFYTDSQIVLHYLQNESKKHTAFISNRLKEIQLNSKFSEWNFVPGNKSPADLYTWPSRIKKITKNSIRANDPTFLEHFIPTETVLI